VKQPLKHFRIVTDNGDSLLIRREALDCLLQSLERLARSGGRRQPIARPPSLPAKKQPVH
jgi:hypothetical protein